MYTADQYSLIYNSTQREQPKMSQIRRKKNGYCFNLCLSIHYPAEFEKALYIYIYIAK